MRLLVSGCSATVKRLMAGRPDRLGVLLTPGNGNAEWWPDGTVWACDNDCFRGLDSAKYLKMLAKVIAFKTRPAWVAIPDVVGDPAETRRRFDAWRPAVAELGLPAAFVTQDGAASGIVPWEEIDCLFVGGSDGWKLSGQSMALTKEARERGKRVHFGRINTLTRMSLIGRAMAGGLGWCDTIDGSGFSRWGEKRIPLGIRWIDMVMGRE